MFKNTIIYRIVAGLPDFQNMHSALDQAPFIECGPTQERSTGWVPPRGEAEGVTWK